MPQRLIRVLLLVLCALAGAPALAQDAPAPRVSLVTFAPGQIYWQRFGHNALLVRDGVNLPQLYNYGIFDFTQKNFFLNFARGRMLYQVEAMPFAQTLQFYAQEGRWAYEQELNLDPAQAARLAAFLEWNVRPENAEYPYDYFLSNCSTRVRDAIDQALGGDLRRQLESRRADHGFRFEATRLISPDLPLALGMDLIMGPGGDGPISVWQQSFVPMVLRDALREVRVNGGPLVSQERWLVQAAAPAEPESPPDMTGSFSIAGVALAAALLLLPDSIAAIVAAACAVLLGLAGVVMLMAWGLTEHWAMYANRNLGLFNPLALLLVGALCRTRKPVSTAMRALALVTAAAAVLTAGLALLPAAAQQQAQWVALCLPLQMALCWRLLRLRPISP